MDMAGLIEASKFSVPTNKGESVIRILIGDLTKLPREDEVDVLVISAFPGKSHFSIKYDRIDRD